MNRIVPLLLSTCLASPLAAAQVTVPAPTGVDAPRPDIEFGATVHMESIRFGGPPRAWVRFSGGPLESRHDVGRDGLPAALPIGRTYRNVTVSTTISALLLDPSIDAAAQVQVGTPPSPPNATPEDAP